MDLSKTHFENIKALKSAILQSRYRAASLVNKELLTLYFAVGKFISHKIEEEKWGAKVIENLSADLQVELPGLRGFSATNMKRMRLFFDSWEQQSLISPSVTAKLENSFLSVSFTHHIEILQRTKSLEERIFYIQKTAIEFWSLSTLKNHLNNQTFQKTGALPNNFSKTIPNDEVRQKALQSLVVFELKTGKFKPEYLGKMNFYLSVLDEYVKQPHENPSIGIILCKEKKNKIVEFSFRDFNKAMGVSTYKTSNILPAAFKGVLPDVDTLKKLMD